MDRIYLLELVKSVQHGQIGRRNFLKQTAVLLGSAAAANLLLEASLALPAEAAPPAAAKPASRVSSAPQAAVASGLVTQLVQQTDASGQVLMGYLSRSADAKPQPAVVVIQEWWGLNQNIKDIANRFAQAGYVAFAPDLYHGAVASEPNDAQKLAMELVMADAVREIQGALGFLLAQSFVAGPKAGIVGFCMGGGLALQTSLVADNVGAAAVFYGRPLTPDQAAQVKAPILGLYGTADQSNPVQAVKTMQDALTKDGVPNEFHLYDGAPHAFFNDTQPSYRADAAADAWQQTLTWFHRYLGSA
jgi:carboxymethylenebutenolidase